MSFDYSHIGLDNNFRNVNSPLNSVQFVDSYTFSQQYQVGAVRLSASRLQVANFIHNTNEGSATGGPFSDGESFTITLTISPTNTYSNTRVLAVPEVSIYQGTNAVGTLKIWPTIGNGISYGDYDSTGGGFDWASSDYQNLVFKLNMQNNSGGDQSVFVYGSWRYIEEREGQSTGS